MARLKVRTLSLHLKDDPLLDGLNTFYQQKSQQLLLLIFSLLLMLKTVLVVPDVFFAAFMMFPHSSSDGIQFPPAAIRKSFHDSRCCLIEAPTNKEASSQLDDR